MRDGQQRRRTGSPSVSLCRVCSSRLVRSMPSTTPAAGQTASPPYWTRPLSSPTRHCPRHRQPARLSHRKGLTEQRRGSHCNSRAASRDEAGDEGTAALDGPMQRRKAALTATTRTRTSERAGTSQPLAWQHAAERRAELTATGPRRAQQEAARGAERQSRAPTSRATNTAAVAPAAAHRETQRRLTSRTAAQPKEATATAREADERPVAAEAVPAAAAARRGASSGRDGRTARTRTRTASGI